MCVCVCEREIECVCVCERESVCACVCTHMYTFQRKTVHQNMAKYLLKIYIE